MKVVQSCRAHRLSFCRSVKRKKQLRELCDCTWSEAHSTQSCLLAIARPQQKGDKKQTSHWRKQSITKMPEKNWGHMTPWKPQSIFPGGVGCGKCDAEEMSRGMRPQGLLILQQEVIGDLPEGSYGAAVGAAGESLLPGSRGFTCKTQSQKVYLLIKHQII